MPQKTYMYDAQWASLINAITQGGGGSHTPIEFNAIQWAELINALTNQQTYTANKVLQSNSDGIITSSPIDINSIVELFSPNIRTLTNDYCDLTYFRIGIIKCIMILGQAKKIIPSGWLPSPALGTLPDDMISLLGSFNLNVPYRGSYITMGLGNTNVLNMNSAAQISSGTAIRTSLWYI